MFNPSDGFTLFVDMDGTMATWRKDASYEDLFEKGYYRNLPPYEEVVDTVKNISKYGVPIYVLSAYLPDSQYAWREKHEWLDEFAPFIPREHRLLCPQSIPKPEFVTRAVGEINESKFLLDDYSKNLHEWARAGGTGIKLMNGINGSNGTWMNKPAVSRFSEPIEIENGIFNVWRMLCIK